MDEWMDGWMGGWVDGWMDGWLDGWMDGWMDGSALCFIISLVFWAGLAQDYRVEGLKEAKKKEREIHELGLVLYEVGNWF